MIQRYLLLIALLMVAFAARARLDAPTPATSAEPLVQFPKTLGTWVGNDSALDAEVIKVAAVDDHLNRYYRSAAGDMGLYIGYYSSQRQGEALHSPLFCLPGAGWQPIKSDTVDLHAGATAPRAVNHLVVERGIDRLLVLYWYQTVARVTASEYWRKLFLMQDAFVSGRTDVALVRIVAPIASRDAGAEEASLNRSRAFAELVMPEVQHRLFRE
jgi:EpsI family protein